MLNKAATVIRRIEAGDRVTLTKSADGQPCAEIRRTWLPMGRVVPLTDYERSLIEVAMYTRRHGNRPGEISAALHG